MLLQRPQINCDLGEGIPFESLIYPWIDRANLACGGHYGDEATLSASLSLAKEAGVLVGAHPSYPDRENFGRKSLKITFPDLSDSINSQISLFQRMTKEADLEMAHIKFHGALYNDAATNAELADFLTDLVGERYPNVPLFVPPYSEIEKLARHKKLAFIREIFGDRSYENNYGLSPRSDPDSLLTRLDQVERHLQAILENDQITSSTGIPLPVTAETICFHGDNPGLMDFLPQIRKKYWT